MKLNNGVSIPIMGYGTFKVPNDEVKKLVKKALDVGYRHIDTAAYYQNEEGVGEGIRESGVPREEIFLTSKVWMDDLGYDETLRAFDRSMKKLGLDYLDLYLVHWPRPLAKDAWKAMERLYSEKRIRAIGVSNYKSHHLEDLISNSTSTIVPAINQIELHPGLQQNETYEYCKKEGIAVEAWSPIMRGKVVNMPELIDIGEKYNKTPVQVTLRWHIQRGIIVIPKSANIKRIEENAQIFDFELTAEEMKQIESLDKNTRLGFDPDYIYEHGYDPSNPPKK